MFKKPVLFLLLPLLCAWTLLAPLPAHAADSTSGPARGTVLRVAIPIPTSDAEHTSSRAYIAYTDEYLHELSKYTGWDYKIVTVAGDYESGLSSVMDMLRAGTVDLVAPVTSGTEDGIFYSQSSYLTTPLELQVPNEVFDGESLGDTVRVAMIRASGQQDSADAFFEMNGITPEYVLCGSLAEQIEQVISGQADVTLNSALEYTPDMTVVARFAPRELYFAAADPVLMEELDQANANIMQSNVLFTQELYQKHVILSSQVLTQAETDFIREAAPYTVAVLDEGGPYQSYNAETDTHAGIGVDLLRHIGENTGMPFRFIRATSEEALQALLDADKVQIVVMVSESNELVTANNLIMTRSYATSPYVLVAPASFSGPGSDQRLALTRTGINVSNGNNIGSVRQYSTVKDCLDAIIGGEADYTYMDLYTARYYLGDPRYAELEFSVQSYTPHDVCFGITSPANPMLLSILNKSINRLSTTDIQQFISQNVNPERQATFGTLIRDYPLQVVLTIIVVALVIAALLILLLWRKEKNRKLLHKKAMEDGLTQLYNAAACRNLITQKLHRMQADQIGAFLIMDMDDFKKINDGFGHQAGDWVIQKFADLLREVLRTDSIIARIGGDEFVAFLPSVSEEENIRFICSRIREQSHSICIGEWSLTLSIGAAVAKSGDSYDTLYRLSDQALYQVKRGSKDQFCLWERGEWDQ